MARKELLYPPSPRDVPDDLTLLPPKFIRQATILIVLIFLIMLVYVGFMVLGGYGVYWALTAKAMLLGKLFVGAMSIVFLFFLVKNFIFRSSIDQEHVIEIFEEDQPKFFDFLHELCDEVGVEFPERVYLHPELNTAMISNLSLLHLFVPPRRALMIGVGLINFLNMSEMKAVIAHEFGHFAQKGFIVSYSVMARRIIASLFRGNDFLDRFLDQHRRRQDFGGALAMVLYWIVWVIKQSLILIFRIIHGLDFEMSRQQEFTSDLVGVSVAGSDASVHALMRFGFASECLNQAYNDLHDAADHRLYSADIFYHQTAAAAYVRKSHKDPKRGERPVLKGPNDGKRVQVFDPETDGRTDPGDYHPSLYDREENAKNVFIPCEQDVRPAWTFFSNIDELRERFSYKFYRVVHKVSKDVELAEPEEVQKFIDAEHAEMTYDPKYGGVYDGRLLNPGELEELDEMIENEPWDDGRLSRVEVKLYKGLEKRVEDHSETLKEFNQLLQESNYRPTGKTKRLIDKLDDQLKENNDWFKSFDRRVYLVYVQMAKRLIDLGDSGVEGGGQSKYKELINRYNFHLPLQSLYRRANDKRNKLEFHFSQLFNRGQQPLTQETVTEAFHEFRQARRTLKEILRDAREMDLPMLKNFTGDEALDEFLLDEPLIKEMPENYVNTKWIDKMYRQLSQVIKRSARLYFKSVGNILALQEQIAKEFNARRPVGEIIPGAIFEEE